MNIATQLKRLGATPAMIAGTLVDGKLLADAEAEAKAKPHKLDDMNKTEARFAAELDWMIYNKQVSRYLFGTVKFRLAKRTWYCPDFVVFWADGVIECVEIKGFVRDDAAVKYKVAREKFPMFKWRMIRRGKDGWENVL